MRWVPPATGAPRFSSGSFVNHRLCLVGVAEEQGSSRTPASPLRQRGSDPRRPYGDALILDRCYDLAVHHDPAQGTVVLEYASAGKVVGTGAPYGNRYISVLTLRDREVVHCRDYLDPIGSSRHSAGRLAELVKHRPVRTQEIFSRTGPW